MEVIKNFVCNITENNIRIIDSYLMTDRNEMREILYTIQYKHPECKVFQRSYKSMIAEWVAHNRLYKLGIEKDRTGTVDINYPLKWYEELFYRIFGIW